MLDFMMGPVAFVGDVSQFYPSISLSPESWPYQKVLIRENIEPNGKLIKAVIVACIFGVCSSGGQLTEGGASVSIPYLTWYPKIDCYKLNTSSLHFVEKSRG